MWRKVLFLVFIEQILSITTTIKPGNTTATSQISSPKNNVSGTEKPAAVPKDDPDLDDTIGALHPIDQIRHFNAPVAFENRRSDSTKSKETASLAEALAKHRCVPTAIARGPCHFCVCSKHGVFFCRPEECSFVDNEQFSSKDQPECERNMLYNEGSLWCNCNDQGLWRSSNCRQSFRYIRTKKSVRTHPDLPTNYTCIKGSHYAVDCNICECKTGVLSIDSCTNRTCIPGHRADECKHGQVLRDPNGMCACSTIGYYVDKFCITFSTNDTIQILTKEQLAALTYEEKSVVIEAAGFKDRCKPNTVINKDCNRCRCTESGELVCTSKLCLDIHTENNLRSKIEKFKKTKKHARKLSSLPELKSDQQSCVPGKQYKYKCNTCMCSKKGVPSCTTMICLDELAQSLGENKLKKDKKKKTLRLNNAQPQVSKVASVGNESIDGASLRASSLPEIRDGEPCLPGHMYRQDCNVCHCTDIHRLLCTKMACINNQPKNFPSKPRPWKRPEKKKPILKKAKKTSHTRYAHRSGKKHSKKTKRQKSKKHLRSEPKGKSREPDPLLYAKKIGVDYPNLPTTKCKPGHIYQKGCQRCFCTDRKIAQCTNRPCMEMTGTVKVPKDVYPRVPAKEFNNLPELPHQAAKCDIGKVYRIDCNLCLCRHNGNLLCNNLLCLAIDEVNRITANKLSGKPCSDDEFTDIDPQVDCVTCKCSRKGKSRCVPVADCTPYRRRRSLHGDLDPKVKPKMVISEDDSHCTPGMVYKQNCNNCYCQDDGSLRCTRKGCLNYELVEKLKEQRERLLNEQNLPPRVAQAVTRPDH